MRVAELTVRSPLALWTYRKEWLVRWCIVGGLFLLDTTWIAVRHEHATLMGSLGLVMFAALLAIASALAMFSFAMKRFGRPLLVLSDFIESIIYVLVLLVAFVIVKRGATLLGTNLNNLFNSVGTQVGTVTVLNL